ncbi:hypothetical protein EGY22_13235 [Alcaligenes faecalis]|nr:hypothetical protein CPY64_07465 [Alcaligenes faecalis]AYZ92361.1 hypothetical protein EGY22_13235 [Alcaligenes faecalis]
MLAHKKARPFFNRRAFFIDVGSSVCYAQLGLAWLGLAWLGLAWLGLAWLGLAWLGLAWLGNHQTSCRAKTQATDVVPWTRRFARAVVGPPDHQKTHP